MKKILGLFILLLFINSLFITFITPAYCWVAKDRNEYLFDARGDDGDLLLNRLSIHDQIKRHELEVSFFAEAQWNIETSEWEKIISGGEIGKYLRKWLYIGQSIQFISGEMLDYMGFDVDANSIDSTTTFALDISLAKDLSIYMFQQYTTNLEKGVGEYSETGIELNYDIKDSCSVGFGWRHTDRIHNLDTDYVSSSVTLNF